MEPRLTEKESKQTKNISLKPLINRKRPYPDDLLMMINDTKEPMYVYVIYIRKNTIMLLI